MYKNKHIDGSLNCCGKKVRALRCELRPYVSQRALAAQLQLQGLDLDKNAIQKMEAGTRFVTDIELLALSRFFHISADELLKPED